MSKHRAPVWAFHPLKYLCTPFPVYEFYGSMRWVLCTFTFRIRFLNYILYPWFITEHQRHQPDFLMCSFMATYVFRKGIADRFIILQRNITSSVWHLVKHYLLNLFAVQLTLCTLLWQFILFTSEQYRYFSCQMIHINCHYTVSFITPFR